MSELNPDDELPTMSESEWPVYAVLMKHGDLYWHDTSWGNRYGTGDGWLMVLPWGEQRERGGLHRGDNRFGVEHEDVAAFTLMNDSGRTPSPEVEALREALVGAERQMEYALRNHSTIDGSDMRDFRNALLKVRETLSTHHAAPSVKENTNG